MNKKGGYLGLIITISLLIWVVLLISGYLPFKIFMVQSGSMEPSIMTGDVIIVKENQSYQMNEVITFKDTTNRVVTHRIVEKSRDGSLTTKGDANKDEDRESVSVGRVIGSVVWVIPKVGYVVNFSRSLPGLVIFIFVPAGYLLITELIKIGNELRKKR